MGEKGRGFAFSSALISCQTFWRRVQTEQDSCVHHSWTPAGTSQRASEEWNFKVPFHTSKLRKYPVNRGYSSRSASQSETLLTGSDLKAWSCWGADQDQLAHVELVGEPLPFALVKDVFVVVISAKQSEHVH